MMMNNPSSFSEWVNKINNQFQRGLDHYLKAAKHPAPNLQEAMHYAVCTNGKRIRPLLVYAVGQIFEAPVENLEAGALAIELIHSYSLIHDDLPAMDNSEWRRGKPSCFKAFGEDIAILAGDALQTLAFEIIANHPASLTAEQRISMVQILSQASGAWGMAGGQALDILNTTALTEKDLLQLYALKTGALLQASIRLGLIAANAGLKESTVLEQYGKSISLAFQIQDDLLDIEGQKDKIGKPTGLDAELAKTTYPALMGIEQAKQKVRLLFAEAYSALEFLGPQAAMLKQLTDYVGKREK